MPPPFSLNFGPFQFASDIDIPELHPAPRTPAPFHGEIRLSPVPQTLPDALVLDDFMHLRPNHFLLNLPGTARYEILNGKEVRVDPDPQGDPRDLRFHLLAWVFGALCHQNGLFPLHSCATRMGSDVTAFFGQSGTGKSTLAAALLERGHAIVADDITLIHPASRQVYPVAHWLKLWQDTHTHLQTPAAESTRVLTGLDKFRLPLPPTEHPGPLTLRRLILLTPADGSPTLTVLPAAEAIAHMMATTYLGYVVEALGNQPLLFQHCAEALAGTETLRLTFPHDFTQLPQTLALVEAALTQL